MKNQTCSRRRFLAISTLAAGAAAWRGPSLLRAAEAASKLNIAMIGVGGQGLSRLKEALRCGANIVALCDVDEKMMEDARKATAAALGRPNTYVDFRKMLESEKSLDGVIIATPDHWHAPAAQAAFAAGKHIFCEKPLAHAISEARALRERAGRSKVVTQLGIQGSAEDTLRRAIELIQGGAIGKVRTVHVWVAKSASFIPGQAAPVGEDPAPGGLHWDNWIGPAPFHPYKQTVYHPKAWRAWYDFGGGSMADWGCHGLNLPFRALNLGSPSEIEADVQGEISASYPWRVRIRFDFAARGALPPVTVWWYDGGRLPPADALPKTLADFLGGTPASGVLILGDNGFTYGEPHPGAQFIQLNDEKELSRLLNHPATRGIAQSLPRVPGHMQEWLAACRTGETPFSSFEVGGPLTETVLSGVVALRAGKKLQWDGPGMRAVNAPEAAPFIHAQYRAGWV
ncbi:MAG: Gfo/Idh/MocA family oxidoreductase [Verrucomicrobiota bacterium]|jgi:predicted dehydrogenase